MSNTTFKKLKCGDANQESMFLSDSEEYDVAVVGRMSMFHVKDEKHNSHLLNDDEWQLLINQIHAIPEMLQLISSMSSCSGVTDQMKNNAENLLIECGFKK